MLRSICRQNQNHTLRGFFGRMSTAHIVTHLAGAQTVNHFAPHKKMCLLLSSKNKTDCKGSVWQRDPACSLLGFFIFVLILFVNPLEIAEWGDRRPYICTWSANKMRLMQEMTLIERMNQPTNKITQ